MRSVWIGRIIIAVVVLATAYLGGGTSLALSLATRDPELALRLDGNQSDALAVRARLALARDPSVEGLKRAAVDARQGMKMNPMDPSFPATLALIAEFRNEKERAKSLMLYSQRLSRRNLPTQLWWIDHWAQEGSIERALQHYDIAMRTTRAGASLLFPVLINAAGNAMVNSELAGVIAEGAPWGPQFLQQMAQSGPDLSAAAMLLEGVALAGGTLPPQALDVLVDRLLAENQTNDAWHLFSQVRPDDAILAIRNSDFRQEPQWPTAFDWRFDDHGASGFMSEDGLHVNFVSETSGVVAQQIVSFPAGTGKIELSYEGGSEGGARPSLSLFCLGDDDRVLGIFGGNIVGRGQLDFGVPPGCPFQRLEIRLEAPDGALSGGQIIINSLRKVS